MDLPILSQDIIDEITKIVLSIPVENPKPCDVIFVFGGSHPGLWHKSAEAYFAGLGKVIIASGGYKPTAQKHCTWTGDIKTPESHVIRKELIQLGIPETVIICEDRSTNSLENVLFAKEVFDFSPISSVLLVCKCYGVGRQCRTFKRNIGKEMDIVPYTFDTTIGSNTHIVTCQNWMQNDVSKRCIFIEALKIYVYSNNGDIEPLTSISEELECLLTQYADKV